MVDKVAGNNTNETAAWLSGQRKKGANWFRMCLALQHEARDIPAVYPTAFTASQATPFKERVPHIADLRRGMVGFTKGPDPAGHVFFILGRRKGFARDDPDGILCESNDVVANKTGAVGIVPLSFFRLHWGHTWQFGATWLNGYDFSDFNKPPKPVHKSLGANYKHAIADVERALAQHKGDAVMERALQRDLDRMKRRLARFS